MHFLFHNIDSVDFSGERIPTLQEAVEECSRLGLVLFIEVKRNTYKVSPVKIKRKFKECFYVDVHVIGTLLPV